VDAVTSRSNREDGALDGRTAIVTGGGANLGAGIVRAFASEGAAVGILVRSNRAGAESVANEVRAQGGKVLVLIADVADHAAVDAAVDECRTTLGPATIAVHSAAHRSIAPLINLDVAEWALTRSVILDGAFHLTRSVIPDMVANAFGRIIYIGGSVLSSGFPINHGHVGAAKAGLVGLARSVAQEYGPAITANVVSPGVIDSDRKVPLTAEQFEANLGQSIMKRPATVEEVAATCTFLASESAAMITAQTFAVDGGVRGINP
jgi:NAD(P)-dependent dehydrogenase (short-subunit alcohol dehydrogenase family)